MSTYAYVMVMFGGDKYLPGILVMGYTIRYCGAIYDIVVMVTNDVSESSVREIKKMNMKVLLEIVIQKQKMIHHIFIQQRDYKQFVQNKI